jgi:glucokinase
MNYAIGLDIGGTSLKSVAVTESGEVLSRGVTPIDPSDPHWPARVRDRLHEVEREQGAPGRCVGVGAPGIAAADGRSIFWMQGRLGEVEGLDWTTFLDRPPLVPVLNDAQAALMGEVWQGAAAGAKNVVLLTLGTGVGGAAMVDGRLLKGHIGRAGHLGHVSLDPDGPPDITGTPGSLEGAIGNCTIRERTAGRYESTLSLAAAHAAGDEAAGRVWLQSVKALAAGIAGLINVLDPEIVIVGGGIAAAGPALFDPLRKHLESFEWRPHGRQARVVPAVLGEYAGALGAAWNAMQGLPSSPARGPARLDSQSK